MEGAEPEPAASQPVVPQFAYLEYLASSGTVRQGVRVQTVDERRGTVLGFDHITGNWRVELDEEPGEGITFLFQEDNLVVLEGRSVDLSEPLTALDQDALRRSRIAAQAREVRAARIQMNAWFHSLPGDGGRSRNPEEPGSPERMEQDSEAGRVIIDSERESDDADLFGSDSER
jgi:hypothetical protein